MTFDLGNKSIMTSKEDILSNKLKVSTSMDSIFEKYAMTLTNIIGSQTWDKTELLAQAMLTGWQEKRQLFLCGNGGSAGNAIHLANDFLYGIASKVSCAGMRVEALPANTAVISCLANDVGYSEIFSE